VTFWHEWLLSTINDDRTCIAGLQRGFREAPAVAAAAVGQFGQPCAGGSLSGPDPSKFAAHPSTRNSKFLQDKGPKMSGLANKPQIRADNNRRQQFAHPCHKKHRILLSKPDRNQLDPRVSLLPRPSPSPLDIHPNVLAVNKYMDDSPA
jgi:hypothetical protein